MLQYFDTEHAKLYGIKGAIIIKYILDKIGLGIGDNCILYNGLIWYRFDINKALTEMPFFNDKKLRYNLYLLVKKEMLLKANLNTEKIDQTLWYCFKPKQ